MNDRDCLIFQVLVLSFIAIFWLVACSNDVILDDVLDDGDDDDDVEVKGVLGKIVVHQTGGFSGVSRLITIESADNTVRIVSVDQRTNVSSENTASLEALNSLWQTLEANDVFSLGDNEDMLAMVADGFGYEVTVQRDDEENTFFVYAPGELVHRGEKRYSEITQAISQFADTHLQTANNYSIDPMPITDISIAVLESFPLQIHVTVKGFLRDGCTTLHETRQIRNGNTIQIHITTKRPKDVFCIQVISEVEERIALEGAFLPGRYKIIVNDAEKEFEI